MQRRWADRRLLRRAELVRFCLQIYEKVARKGQALFEKALAALHPTSSPYTGQACSTSDLYGINTLAGERFEVMKVQKNVKSLKSAQLDGDRLLVPLRDPGTGIARPGDPAELKAARGNAF
jgi:hypothetical protein